jgi:hypothetical protein
MDSSLSQNLEQSPQANNYIYIEPDSNLMRGSEPYDSCDMIVQPRDHHVSSPRQIFHVDIPDLEESKGNAEDNTSDFTPTV